MEKYLEKFGSNFIVAAFVPSLTFIIICVITFVPLLVSPFDPSLILKIPETLDNLGKYGLLILLLGIILSFTLSSLNTFMTKLLEGYVILEHFPMLLAHQKKRERKLRRELERVKRKADELTAQTDQFHDPNLVARYYRQVGKLRQIQNSLATAHRYSFPSNSTELLPTRFGNILKSAEYYSADRYNIDSVPLWPRLLYAIAPSYLNFIDESNNELSFLINCMFLCLIFSLIALPVSIYLMINNQPEKSWIYIILTIFSFCAAYIFHRASLYSVSGILVK